nr:MAG TPA: hypothetical protein [Caudoviricetes sp.]
MPSSFVINSVAKFSIKKPSFWVHKGRVSCYNNTVPFAVLGVELFTW